MKQNNIIFKVISILILIAFPFQQVSYAAPPYKHLNIDSPGDPGITDTPSDATTHTDLEICDFLYERGVLARLMTSATIPYETREAALDLLLRVAKGQTGVPTSTSAAALYALLPNIDMATATEWVQVAASFGQAGGTLRTAELAESRVVNRGATIEKGARLKTEGSGRIILGEGAVVKAGAEITAGDGETVVVGRETSILSDARLMGDITIGKNSEVAGIFSKYARIGNNVKIHRPDSNIQFAEIGDNVHINGSTLRGYGRGKDELVIVAGGEKETRIDYSHLYTVAEKKSWSFISKNDIDQNLDITISQYLLRRYKIDSKSTIIEEGARIVSAQKIENTHFGREAEVNSPTYIGHCIIGEKSIVRPNSNFVISYFGRETNVGSEISKCWLGDGFVSEHLASYLSVVAPNEYLLVDGEGKIVVVSLPNTTNIAGGTKFANYGGEPAGDLSGSIKGTAFMWTGFTGANSNILNLYAHPDVALEDIFGEKELTVVLPFSLTKGQVWGLVPPFTYADGLSPKSHKIGWTLEKDPGIILNHLLRMKELLSPEQMAAFDQFVEGNLRLGLHLIELERQKDANQRRWTDEQLDEGERIFRLHLENGVWKMKDGQFVEGHPQRGLWYRTADGRWVNERLQNLEGEGPVETMMAVGPNGEQVPIELSVSEEIPLKDSMGDTLLTLPKGIIVDTNLVDTAYARQFEELAEAGVALTADIRLNFAYAHGLGHKYAKKLERLTPKQREAFANLFAKHIAAGLSIGEDVSNFTRDEIDVYGFILNIYANREAREDLGLEFTQEQDNILYYGMHERTLSLHPQRPAHPAYDVLLAFHRAGITEKDFGCYAMDLRFTAYGDKAPELREALAQLTAAEGVERMTGMPVAPEEQYVCVSMSGGATKLQVVAMRGTGEIVAEATTRWEDVAPDIDIKNDAKNFTPIMIDTTKRLVSQVVAEAGLEWSQVAMIGMGCAGPLSERTRTLGSPTKLMNLAVENCSIGQILEQEFGVPALLWHDAHSGLIGQLKMGALKGKPCGGSGIYGTGLNECYVDENGNLVLDGEITSEVGHNVIGAPIGGGRYVFRYVGAERQARLDVGQKLNPHPWQVHTEGQLQEKIFAGTRQTYDISEAEAQKLMAAGEPREHMIWISNGELDYEDVCSGTAKDELLADKGKLMAWFPQYDKSVFDQITTENINELASGEGDVAVAAREIINLVGKNIGRAHAAIVAYYVHNRENSNFVNNFVLTEGMGENLGLGVMSDEHGDDLFMAAVKERCYNELRAFKVDEARAGVIASGIVRSPGRREIFAFMPSQGQAENYVAAAAIANPLERRLRQFIAVREDIDWGELAEFARAIAEKDKGDHPRLLAALDDKRFEEEDPTLEALQAKCVALIADHNITSSDEAAVIRLCLLGLGQGSGTEASHPGQTPTPLGQEGYSFRPQYNFALGKPLDVSMIRSQRTAEEVLELLKTAGKIEIKLIITGPLRGIDGPGGSSLDLPEFQTGLTPIGARALDELPSTFTIASEFPLKVRFELAEDPNAIEYVAPEFGITKEDPYRIRGEVVLTPHGRTPEGQKDAPAFILGNIFKLRGIRVVCEIPPMALAGGMESSDVFNILLLAGANRLSGGNLSFADIFTLAVKLQNDEFGEITGGQGHLCTILGGAHQHVWLSGVKDKDGNLINPYSAFSRQILTDDQLHKVEEHMMLVQAGKEYQDGRPVVERTSDLVNEMWTDLLRDQDSVGLPLHKEKLGLATRYAKALQEEDFEAVTQTTNRYVDIRDELCRRWINLMLDAQQGKAVPPYALGYARKVFDQTHPEYKDYKLLRDMYAQYGEELRTTSPYTLEPISGLIKEARKQGIAIMPLGAGGPGANSMAVSPKGQQHLRKFFESQGLAKLTEEGAREVVMGTGTLMGYMPFRTSTEPIQFEGFSELELEEPQRPRLARYDDDWKKMDLDEKGGGLPEGTIMAMAKPDDTSQGAQEAKAAYKEGEAVMAEIAASVEKQAKPDLTPAEAIDRLRKIMPGVVATYMQDADFALRSMGRTLEQRQRMFLRTLADSMRAGRWYVDMELTLTQIVEEYEYLYELDAIPSWNIGRGSITERAEDARAARGISAEIEEAGGDVTKIGGQSKATLDYGGDVANLVSVTRRMRTALQNNELGKAACAHDILGKGNHFSRLDERAQRFLLGIRDGMAYDDPFYTARIMNAVAGALLRRLRGAEHGITDEKAIEDIAKALSDMVAVTEKEASKREAARLFAGIIAEARRPKMMMAVAWIADETTMPEEKAQAAENFNEFEAPFEATPQTCTITRLSAGNINPTYQLRHTETGRQFIVQLVNSIFGPAAVDNNLQLLELAQAKAHQVGGILPENWVDVHYANVKEGTSKIHPDAEGNAWRVMDFIEYDQSQGEGIYNAFGNVPAADRWDAARSLGEATAIFGAMLGVLTPEDITAAGLQPWMSPLPGFHVHSYYRDWLFAVRDGRTVPKHLSRETDLSEPDPADVSADILIRGMGEALEGTDLEAPNETELGALVRTWARVKDNFPNETAMASAIDALPADATTDLDAVGSKYADTASKATALKALASAAGIVAKDDAVIATYPDGQARVAATMAEYEARAPLIDELAGIGVGVMHNDTKINNYVFKRNPQTGKLEVVALIDLDTVQLGDLLDDIGDALRSAGNPVGEEPEDGIDSVRIDIGTAAQVINGFLAKVRAVHGEAVANQLRPHVLTIWKIYYWELGSRFFGDSLVGNKYFKLNPMDPNYRVDQNLYRGEVQMRALQELEKVEQQVQQAHAHITQPATRQALYDAHEAHGKNIVQKGMKVVMAEEFLDEQEVSNQSEDVVIVPLEQAIQMALGVGVDDPENTIVLLRDIDVDDNLRANARCRVLSMENYSFLHLGATLELARAILTGNRPAARTFLALIHPGMTADEIESEVERLLTQRGIIALMLPPIVEQLIEGIDQLKGEYAKFVTSA